MENKMRTIQMTLDDDLVAAVDNIVKKLKTTRSAFARKALKDAIKQLNINMLEKNIKKDMSVILSAKRKLAFGNQNKNGVINEASCQDHNWKKSCNIFSLQLHGEYFI
jgi:metal-responsive CopG/Arc/MetJ family transcriptional regulator